MLGAVTLSLYIARQFTWSVLAMLAALSGLVSLFDFIELLRRSASKPEATFGLVTQIAALRLPLHRHADPALRCAARRHPGVLATDPLVGADRRAGGRDLRLAVPRRPDALRHPARRPRHGRDQPALLGHAGPGGGAGQHLPAHRAAALWR